MYSDARRPPRVAGARPSSRSELRKRRWPSISAVEMRVEAWAAASAGVTESTVASSERRVGIGALRSWENGGGEVYAVLAGAPGIGAKAEQLGKYGADVVIVVESADFAQLARESLAATLAD